MSQQIPSEPSRSCSKGGVSTQLLPLREGRLLQGVCSSSGLCCAKVKDVGSLLQTQGEGKPWHLNRWSSLWALLVNKRAVEVVEARDDKCCLVIQPHSADGAWIRKTNPNLIRFTRIFHVSAFLFAVYTWWWSQGSLETHTCCVCFVSWSGLGFFHCHYLLLISWACVTPCLW